uniref:DUF2283 domain-containing protein n=1 Tax=Candidatus Kentrum sp. UNK TaxID=2126344 RepID=A0A451B577_9GAMM|nr:MAG: Protein of unknown function (DUF2283) [Candidatus Kentron sp. UNK]VFK73435.1 MAG: Protein of unknown function (DUF2283) [Candidatus Kentron sp. UNK]
MNPPGFQVSFTVIRLIKSLLLLPAFMSVRLYISFDRPQNATDSEMTEDGFLLRYRGEQLIGVTILDASIRAPWNAVEG